MKQENLRSRQRKLIARAVAAVGLGTVALWTNAHAGTFTWAGTFTPAVGDWSAASNWSPNSAAPGSADLALFGLAGGSTTAGQVTNNVDVNTTVSSLWYAGGQAAASGSIFTTTQIPTGVTLTISNTGTGNSFVVGTEQSTDNTVVTAAAVTGAGSLVVNNPQGVFTVRQGAAANGTQKATLDMSGLV